MGILETFIEAAKRAVAPLGISFALASCAATSPPPLSSPPPNLPNSCFETITPEKGGYATACLLDDQGGISLTFHQILLRAKISDPPPPAVTCKLDTHPSGFEGPLNSCVITPRLTLVAPNGKKVIADILATTERGDVSIGQIEGSVDGLERSPLLTESCASASPIQKGQTVYVQGVPHYVVMDKDGKTPLKDKNNEEIIVEGAFKVSVGIITDTRNNAETVRLAPPYNQPELLFDISDKFSIEGDVYPGMSGGSIVNQNGCLIGLVNAAKSPIDDFYFSRSGTFWATPLPVLWQIYKQVLPDHAAALKGYDKLAAAPLDNADLQPLTPTTGITLTNVRLNPYQPPKR